MKNINQINLVIETDSNGVSVHIEGGPSLRLNRQIDDLAAYDPNDDPLLMALLRNILGGDGMLVDAHRMTGGAN